MKSEIKGKGNKRAFQQIGGSDELYASLACSASDREQSRRKIAEKSKNKSAAVFSDIEGYESPVTGEWIDGRKARREDLKRTNCRPFEKGEKEHAAQVRADNVKREERLIDQIVQEVANSTRF